MSKYTVDHHKIIDKALHNFNAEFLREHNILFGGGTSIALRLDEFRESIDIDFLCADKESYRAVRNQVSNSTLGDLVQNDFDYVREISFNRYAVRTGIKINDTVIKLEFISFPDYGLSGETSEQLPVPCLDKASCFMTKLLANADRVDDKPYKDIFDLVAMYLEWGEIPEKAWLEADKIYSRELVRKKLLQSLEQMLASKSEYINHAQAVKMKSVWADRIINSGAKAMSDYLKDQPSF